MIQVSGRCVSKPAFERGDTHMVGGAVLPIQRLGDEHLPEHGVDIEHLVGRLIGADARDAVADRDVLILVRADLKKNKGKSNNRSQSASHLYFFSNFLSPEVETPTQIRLRRLNST